MSFAPQVRCQLSRRQRRLYDEYMMSSETKSTLAAGNFIGIMSCLMQLRKVSRAQCAVHLLLQAINCVYALMSPTIDPC